MTEWRIVFISKDSFDVEVGRRTVRSGVDLWTAMEHVETMMAKGDRVSRVEEDGYALDITKDCRARS